MKRRRILPRRRGRLDVGDTLLEVLIALVIIALAVGPVLGTLIESLASSAEHRSLAAIDTILKSFAETAKSAVELSPPAGRGSLSGTAVTSVALFSGANTFDGDGITGTGVAPNSTLSTETNTSHTAVLSATATTESTVTLTIVLYKSCATTYPLLSRPSTLSGPVGTPVTVFATGFGDTKSLSKFRVTVGTQTAPIVTAQSQTSSGAYGNIEITFTPKTLLPTPTPQSIVVHGVTTTTSPMTVRSMPNAGFTVTSGSLLITRSPDARFTLGITSVSYWNAGTGKFQSSCTSSGVQMVTLTAGAPNRVHDTLAFVLRDPSYFAPPVPVPSLVVTGKGVARPYSGGPAETLVFTAAVSAPSTNPAPSGTITWTVTAPNGTTHPTCTPTPAVQGIATGTKTLVSICNVPLTTTSAFGTYTAVARYSGDAYTKGASKSATATVYAPDGSGSMAVTPTAVLTGSTHTLTMTYTAAAGGTSGAQVDVAVPAGWTAPTTTASGPGYASASGGTGSDAVTVTGRTIQVNGVTLNAGQRLTVTITKESAPTTRGRSTFTTHEYSTTGGTPTVLRSGSPVVVVAPSDVVSAGANATNGKTVTTPNFTTTAGTTYLVYAFSSLSGTTDTASPTSTGFTSALTFTPIVTTPATTTTVTFDSTQDHVWAWYTTATGGSGSIKVTFGNTIAQAYVEVVKLVGNAAPPTPPYITANKAFHAASAAGTSANANLSTAPTNGTDPEVIFLATEGNLGTTVPHLRGFVTTATGFVHNTGGSFAVYTGLATQTKSITIPSNWWGTTVLEING